MTSAMKMTNEDKFDYVIHHLRLKDGVIYFKDTCDPVPFKVVKRKHEKKGGYLQASIKLGKGRYLNITKHQVVYMLHHNRPIGEGMHIHHIDGDPSNNSPDNLIELSYHQHVRIHAFMNEDPLRCVYSYKQTWYSAPTDINGVTHNVKFDSCELACLYRDLIELPLRHELRCLGLDC